MGIIDMHCDTLFECFFKGLSLRDAEGHLNLEKMKEAGGTAQCFAIFPDIWRVKEEKGADSDPYELFQEAYEYYLMQLAANEDVIRPAFTAGQIRDNKRNGYLSALLTVEDCALVAGRQERIRELAQKGVVMAGLTWNYENCMGFPHSGDPEEHRRGLKPFGFEAVELMNEAGIVVDVSHLSEGGFYDVARCGKKPFAASHSCARGLCGHSRNLNDQQLHTIGETGGVAGVNFYSLFLTEESDYTAISRIAEHAVYMADKAGIESVALGSDFDGIGGVLEMEGYEGYPLLIGELQKHFSDDDVERITEGNFLRVLEECGAGRK